MQHNKTDGMPNIIAQQDAPLDVSKDKGGDSDDLYYYSEDYFITEEDELSLIEETKPQKTAVKWGPMLITSLVCVVCFAPLANLSSKWGFNKFSYPVPPSEITPELIKTQFSDNIAQIAFKHSMTLVFSAFMYMIDSRVIYKR